MIKYVLIFFIGLAVSGCGAARDYATVRKNMQVEKLFRTGEMQPQYRYYYSGPDSEPVALLALHESYALNSQFWHEFTDGEQQLREWLWDFNRLDGGFDDIGYLTIDYEGSEILSTDNRRIGLVYSRYDWIVAWWGEGNEIVIAPPEPTMMQGSPLFFRDFHRDHDH